jgi:hypothetical protein
MSDSVEAGSASSKPLLFRSWFAFLFLLLVVAVAALLWKILIKVETIESRPLEASE